MHPLARLAWLMAVVFSSLGIPAAAQAAAGRRIVVAIGSNVGLEHEVDLQFGSSDANAFADVMQMLGGAAASDVYRVLEPNKHAVETALDTVVQRATADATLILYYSGHGNETQLHVAGDTIPREWLRAKLEEAPARLRLMFIDACRGVKERGLEPARAFQIGLVGYHGLVLIQSASRGEVAFESQRLQGGLFTRHLLSGLRGPADVDGDGRVSLDEAYTFAHVHTLLDSGSTQIPERQLQIRGAGALELTRVVTSEARAILPVEHSARYTFYRKGSLGVFTEAWSSRSTATEVALPPGAFLVWRRLGDDSRMASFEAKEDTVHRLETREFEAVEREVMQERGGTVMLYPHRVEFSAGLAVAPGSKQAAGAGYTVGLDYTWRTSERTSALTFGARLLTERLETSLNDGERTSYQLSAGLVSPVLHVGPAALHGSVGVLGMWTEQARRDKTGAGEPESESFQRVGGVLQLSAQVAMSEALGWTLNLALVPTLFFEKDEAVPSETQPIPMNGAQTTATNDGAHVSASALILVTMGFVFGL